jgi:RNA polymerase sporulation-specific sigma factor
LNKKKYTVEEFSNVVDGIYKGDVDKKEKLLDMIEPLIISSIKRYYYGDELMEDMIQEGKIRVLECLDTFDSEKGVYFLGYVKAQLRYLYLNLNKAKEFEISLNSTLDLGDGSVELIDSLIDETVDVEGDLIKKYINKNLKDTLDILTDRESQVIYLYYFKNIGMKDIAKELGLAYRTVVNTKVNGVEKVRKTLKIPRGEA